jgi:hypothetical protein
VISATVRPERGPREARPESKGVLRLAARFARGSLRTNGCVLVILLALLGTPRARAGDGVASVASRDWTSAPAVVEVDAAREILAVGDVHGDDERLLDLLAGAGVIERARPQRWKAGKAVLVFTGDYIDKGPHGLAVLEIVRGLEKSAAAAGGRVIALAGNHEVELLASPAASKGALFRGELDAARIPIDDFVAGRHELGAWLRTRPFAARVGDWFFSHAGKTDGRTIAELERAIRDGIEKDGFAARELLRDDSIVEARLKPPWWEAGGSPEAVLDRALRALRARHLVFGHQPGHVRFADGSERKKGELFQKWGRVFLIDTGMSRGVGDSRGALLRIHGNEAFAVGPDGAARSIWRGE